jgi:hypothetical protein
VKRRPEYSVRNGLFVVDVEIAATSPSRGERGHFHQSDSASPNGDPSMKTTEARPSGDRVVCRDEWLAARIELLKKE